MNYEQFKEYIKERLPGVYVDIMTEEMINHKGDIDKKELDKIKNCEVHLRKVDKNNGVTLDAISIYMQGENVSPNIYIKPYYYQYMVGKPLDTIMANMIFNYRNQKLESKNIQRIYLDDFHGIKDKIIIRLINTELNKELLKKCPHIDYLDLSITFRIIFADDSNGMATSLIIDEEFKKWDIDLQELYKIALDNTSRLYPYRIIPLFDIVLKNMDKLNLSDEINSELPEVNIFVLTNMDNINGAGAILYANVLSDFAKEHDSNIFILPSSVHEQMLVVESDDTDPAFLKSLLNDANHSSVGLIDLLGDNIYYYDRNTDEVSIYKDVA